MTKILFSGDSITDCCRARNMDRMLFEGYLGHGYATLITSRLGYENPGQYAFFNRGIAGARLCHLREHLQTDVIDLKPDVLSVLIGINDVWETVAGNQMSAALFEEQYEGFLSDVFSALPDVKLIVMEPFVHKGAGTAEKWDAIRACTDEFAVIVRKIAKKRGVPCLPMQKLFDDALGHCQPEELTCEGFHPTPAGHELIARAWIDVFNKL